MCIYKTQSFVIMPLCKNGSSYYKGTEPSPKGRGYCAHNEKIGSTKLGRDRKKWAVRKFGKTKRWVKVRVAKKKKKPTKKKPAKKKPAKKSTKKLKKLKGGQLEQYDYNYYVAPIEKKIDMMESNEYPDENFQDYYVTQMVGTNLMLQDAMDKYHSGHIDEGKYDKQREIVQAMERPLRELGRKYFHGGAGPVNTKIVEYIRNGGNTSHPASIIDGILGRRMARRPRRR